MNNSAKIQEDAPLAISPLFTEEAFTRSDPSDDSIFYLRERFVSHLDSLALSTVEKVIGTLVIEERPVILDLMASWDSHLPAKLSPSKVVGLGLNRRELEENRALTEIVIHDLNRVPKLPFPEETFDVVINTVSVDYMTNPFGVFREVGRIIRPGGLFLVIFSNRMFPQKAVKVWRESSEEERILLVEDYFRASGLFEKASLFVSKGKPRPREDKYASTHLPSDPLYALYAEKKGGDPSRRPRPVPEPDPWQGPGREEVERRKREVRKTLRCPHCNEKMKKWAVPENPFTCTWDNDFLYICFNDYCPYYIRGWDFMAREGNFGSYRLMYNPEKDTCNPIPVPTPRALRESICG